MTECTPFTEITAAAEPPAGYEDPTYCTDYSHTDYLLDINEGSITLTCTTCHRPVHGDEMDGISTGSEIPVTAEWTHHPAAWEEEAESYGTLTPRDGSEQLRAERDQLGAEHRRLRAALQRAIRQLAARAPRLQAMRSPWIETGLVQEWLYILADVRSLDAQPPQDGPQQPHDNPAATPVTGGPDAHQFEPQPPAEDLGEDDTDEARDLARALLAAFMELADSRGDLSATNGDLEYERLPMWLTNQPDAPAAWERDDPYEDITLRDVDPAYFYECEEADRAAEKAYEPGPGRDGEAPF